MAIVSLQQVKDYLKVETTDEDALLSDLISRAQDELEKIRYQTVIEQTNFTDEQYDGYGDAELLLNNYPVTEVSSVKIDDTVVDTDNYTFRQNEGILLRIDGGVWTKGSLNIKVSYTAGYASDNIPGHLQRECLDLIAHLYENRGGTDEA